MQKFPFKIKLCTRTFVMEGQDKNHVFISKTTLLSSYEPVEIHCTDKSGRVVQVVLCARNIEGVIAYL